MEHDYKNKAAAHDFEMHGGPAERGKPQMVISAERVPQLGPDVNRLPASPASNSHRSNRAGILTLSIIKVILVLYESKTKKQSNSTRCCEVVFKVNSSSDLECSCNKSGPLLQGTWGGSFDRP